MHFSTPCLLVLLAAGLAAAQQRLNNCPPMWSGSGNSCLQFFKQPLPWQEASNFCAKFSSCATGGAGTLMAIDSASADVRLEKFLGPKGNPTPPNVWIGLGDPMNTGVLTWPDGSTPQSNGYSNFAQGGRNGNCVLKDAVRTNMWTYAPCTQANSFVCQMDRNPAPIGGPGTVNPSRPV